MTDNIDTISSDSFPNGADVTPVGGDETGSQVGAVKDALGQILGKQFKSDEATLKFVKDNVEYVGKARNYQPLIAKLEERFGSQNEAVQSLERLLNVNTAPAPQAQPQADTSNFVSREEFAEMQFYAKRPELEAHKILLNSFAKAQGISLEQAVNDASIKTLIDKAQAYDQVEQSKSVLQSNPRLGQVTDKMSRAREALSQGNKDAAAADAVSAVLDAFELR